MHSFDVLCVGGGVIGLSIAYELALRGRRVAVLDRGRLGRESSWAGAGIVSPAGPADHESPYERLRSASYRRLAQWDREISETTGIDIGYRKSGGIEIARAPEHRELLIASRAHRTALGIPFDTLSSPQAHVLEPGLASSGEVDWVPDLCQVRNPRLLRGLAAICRQAGVALFENCEAMDIAFERGRVSHIDTNIRERFTASDVVVSAGAWSGRLLAKLVSQPIEIFPVQGQIIVFQTSMGDVSHIILEGKRYLVPRDDGLVLVGATEEDVGYAKQITPEAIESLRQFAESLFPVLATRKVVNAWAGLRPGNRRGFPFLGAVEGIQNLWLATGHFRHGVQQAPGTAVLLADWITGAQAFAQPNDFGLDSTLDFPAAFHS